MSTRSVELQFELNSLSASVAPLLYLLRQIVRLMQTFFLRISMAPPEDLLPLTIFEDAQYCDMSLSFGLESNIFD